MAFSATNWAIDRSSKNISYIGDDHGGTSPSYDTVIDFHRWLQDLADDAVASGDDELDITNVDPSRRSTDNIITLINGYTIGGTESEHLYDGSIIMNGGDDIYDGIVNFGNASVQIQIIQEGAVLSDDWWNQGGAGLNADATQGISHRFMIPTRESGTDKDGRRLIGLSRTFGNTYSEFKINGTARGNNVLALSDSNDLNNETSAATVSTWTGIVNQTVGYVGLDVNNDSTDEYYYSEWNTNQPTRSINDFYERMKWLTRDGTSSVLYGLSGELFRGITHQVAYDARSGGSFAASDSVTWTGTAAGTGQVLAASNGGSGTGTIWIQLLTGVSPADNCTLTQSAVSASATASIVDRESTITTPFIGQSTGSALIGGYGVGLEVLDLSSTDKVTALDNVVYYPPNNVTNTVAGLATNSDRVLVAPWDGTSYDTNNDPAIDKDQLSLAGDLTNDDISSFSVQETIPADTPSAGTIRVTDDNGFERRLEFSSWSSSKFMITTTDGNEDFGTTNASSGSDVYISYIDAQTTATQTQLSFTSVQDGSRNLVVIVRYGDSSAPIKQFISSWSQTSSNQTITAIRTTDL